MALDSNGQQNLQLGLAPNRLQNWQVVRASSGLHNGRWRRLKWTTKLARGPRQVDFIPEGGIASSALQNRQVALTLSELHNLIVTLTPHLKWTTKLLVLK